MKQIEEREVWGRHVDVWMNDDVDHAMMLTEGLMFEDIIFNQLCIMLKCFEKPSSLQAFVWNRHHPYPCFDMFNKFRPSNAYMRL